MSRTELMETETIGAKCIRYALCVLSAFLIVSVAFWIGKV